MNTTYYLNRLIRRVTGLFLFEPGTDPRAHRTDCGYWGPCDCKASK